MKMQREQMTFYNKQMTIMKDSVKTTKKINHDMQNHLLSIKLYLNIILNQTSSINSYVNSENIIMDSLVNYKISVLHGCEIQFNKDIIIPNDLKLDSFKMTVTIGNLLDNAIEATSKLDNNKI